MTLTPRQRQVVLGLIADMTVKEIALRLGTKENNIYAHWAKIKQLLGVSSHLGLLYRVMQLSVLVMMAGCGTPSKTTSLPPLPPLPPGVPQQKVATVEKITVGKAVLTAPQAATMAVVPPTGMLSIVLQTNNVLLSWPTNSARCYVAESPVLPTANWYGLYPATKTNAGVCSLSLRITNAQTFYRLLQLTNKLASVNVAWSYTNSDSNLAGFRLYQSTTSRNYTNVVDCGTNLTWRLTNCPAGMSNYFAATAYNNAAMESEYSNEASCLIP
jgi:DNA-binding CsgD family transcriptional regulator